VDAGSGVRRLGNALIQEGRFEYTMIFTHAHWDHLLGFPFFKPLHMSKASITIYGCPLEQGNMQTLLANTMAPPYFPVPFDKVRAAIRYHNTCYLDDMNKVGSIIIRAAPLSHPNLGLGFKFIEDGKSFVFLTDNELTFRHRGGLYLEEYVNFCRGAELLIHDAEYTEEEYKHTRGWGHSTYKSALNLAMAARVKRFGLFHHNQDRDDRRMDAIVEACRNLILVEGADIECFGVTQDTALQI